MVARRLPCLRLLAAAACVSARGNEAIGGCTLADNATHGAIVSDGAFCPDGYDFPRTPEQCAAAAVASGLFEAAAQEQDGPPVDLEPGGGGVFCALVAAEAGCRTVFVPDGRCSDPEPDRVRALCLPCKDEGFSCEPGPKRLRTGRPLPCGPAAAPVASGAAAEDPAASAEPGGAGAEPGAAEGSEALREEVAEDPAANAEPPAAGAEQAAEGSDAYLEVAAEDPPADAETGTAERSDILLEAEAVSEAEDVAEAEPEDPPANAKPGMAERSEIPLEAESMADAEKVAEAEPEDPHANAEPGTAERSEILLEAEVVADAEDMAEAEPEDPPASAKPSTAERSEILLEAKVVAEAEDVAQAEPEDPPADAEPGTAERSQILLEAEAVAEAEVVAEAQPEDGSGSCAANASGEPGSNCSPAPGSANDSLQEKLLPPACARPDLWCSHPGAVYSERDCDVDGVLDPYCEENASGFSRGVFRGYISSVSSCLINTFPVGGCNRTCPVPLGWCLAMGDKFELVEDCDGDGTLDPTCNSSKGSYYISSALGCQSFGSKCGEKIKACPRPMWWCTGEDAKYEEKDCDRDEIPDPYCAQGSRTGYLSSAKHCTDTWPSGGCNGSCTVPEEWCNTPGEVYMEMDCDGDGVPDPYCNSPLGQVFLSSNVLCKLATDCLAHLPSGSCKRPPLWCAGSTYSREDCDFDGLPDPVCRRGEESGFVSSADGCSDSWPNGGINGTCLRPAGWCQAGHGVYKNSDCDGDGLPDPTCHWANGTIGLVSSKQGCELLSAKGCSSGCQRPPDFCRAEGERFLHEDFDFDGNADAVCQSPDEDYPYGLLSAFGCMEGRVYGSRCARFESTCEIMLPGSKLQLADCDGDGLEDVVCATSRRTSPSFYYSSAYSCNLVPFSYTCRTPWTPRHLLSLMECPSVDGNCARPEFFCNETPTTGTGHPNFSMFDADGDGIEDPTCVWEGLLGLKRCAVVSSKYGCLNLWTTNCTNLTSDLADRTLPNGYMSRLEHRWYALQNSVGCSLRWMDNSVGKQGRVLGRKIATRTVFSAGLLLCIFFSERRKLLARERLEPGSLGGESAGVRAFRRASLPCRALAGAWACFGIFLDKELLRTCTFGSGLREALAMMEASWGAGVLQDASALLPFSAGCVAAEFLLARFWVESFGAGAILRTLHCLTQVAIWPQLQQRNRAVRYAMLQIAGELEEALEVCDWLLRRSRWSGHRPAKRLLSAARLLALLALRAAPGLAALRSLRLHPPYRHLWLADSAGKEAFPLAGPELVLLCLGCFLPPLLSLFRAGLGLAAMVRS